VLDAARALFSEQGVDAVSIQAIATQAGVSKATVFHHFANKEALYIEVIRSGIRYSSEDVSTLIASDAPFEERFLSLIQSQLRDMLDDPRGTRLVLREVTNGNVERAKMIATEIFSQRISQRIAFFENARDRGELREGIEPILCDMLLGACCMFHFNCREVSTHISMLVGKQAPNTPEEFAAAVCSALTHGLASPATRKIGAGKPRKPRTPSHRSPSLKP
jgi:TetR/AcrR family transcriptional regulator